MIPHQYNLFSLLFLSSLSCVFDLCIFHFQFSPLSFSHTLLSFFLLSFSPHLFTLSSFFLSYSLPWQSLFFHSFWSFTPMFSVFFHIFLCLVRISPFTPIPLSTPFSFSLSLSPILHYFSSSPLSLTTLVDGFCIPLIIQFISKSPDFPPQLFLCSLFFSRWGLFHGWETKVHNEKKNGARKRKADTLQKSK